MGKIACKDESISNSNSQIPQEKLNKILADKDVKELQLILKTLSEKYNIDAKSLVNIAEDIESIQVPTSIYSDEKLSMLEATTKYLKDELSLKFSQIGAVLNRDERTIWSTYHNSLKKSQKKLEVTDGISIPIKILSERKFSILEQATGFLKEEHKLRFSEIARMLKLDDRTIWTCYNRLKNKRKSENEAR